MSSLPSAGVEFCRLVGKLHMRKHVKGNHPKLFMRSESDTNSRILYFHYFSCLFSLFIYFFNLILRNQVQGSQDNSSRRKTSKYFSAEKPKDEKEKVEVLAKRKTQTDNEETIKPSPARKIHKFDDDEDDFVLPNTKKNSVAATPRKKLKSGSGRGTGQKPMDIDESDDDDEVKHVETPSKSGGRGHGGGRGASATPAGGRGRGGGRGGFMNFGERKDPPHKGQKVKHSLI